MPAKKKETQSTEKTSPVKSMTIVELRVIFDRLRKKYNERYDEETFKNERFDVVHNLILRLMDNEWPFYRIMTYINKIRSGEIKRIPALEILDEADKEELKSKHDVDLYTYDEQRLIIRLTDNGWPDYRIKEYINKIRSGEICGMTASKLLEEMDKKVDPKKAQVYFKESVEDKKDMVNHPPHYNVGGFEVIDIIKTFTEGLEGIEAVDTANAIKYILRWHRKNGVEDLKKAKWYIEHLIKEIEDDSN